MHHRYVQKSLYWTSTERIIHESGDSSPNPCNVKPFIQWMWILISDFRLDPTVFSVPRPSSVKVGPTLALTQDVKSSSLLHLSWGVRTLQEPDPSTHNQDIRELRWPPQGVVRKWTGNLITNNRGYHSLCLRPLTLHMPLGHRRLVLHLGPLPTTLVRNHSH